jgi:hypothetical protein
MHRAVLLEEKTLEELKGRKTLVTPRMKAKDFMVELTKGDSNKQSEYMTNELERYTNILEVFSLAVSPSWFVQTLNSLTILVESSPGLREESAAKMLLIKEAKHARKLKQSYWEDLVRLKYRTCLKAFLKDGSDVIDREVNYETKDYGVAGAYKGEMVNGERMGHGIYNWKNGDRYIGEWKTTRDGFGLQLWKESSITYNGAWKSGKKDGFGTQSWPSGAKYSGHWVGDSKHGIGTYLWPSGACYIGEYCYDVMQGNGTMKYATGNQYSGMWNQNKYNGYGTYTWENGDVYIGQWKDNLRNGDGIFKSIDGSKYDGAYVNNLKCGQGTLSDKDGSYSGDWLDDKKHGQGTFMWKDGSNYIGAWENNMQNGYGTMNWNNGMKYEGMWLNDKCHGHGTMTNADGTKWRGTWDNNDKIIE